MKKLVKNAAMSMNSLTAYVLCTADCPCSGCTSCSTYCGGAGSVAGATAANIDEGIAQNAQSTAWFEIRRSKGI